MIRSKTTPPALSSFIGRSWNERHDEEFVCNFVAMEKNKRFKKERRGEGVIVQSKITTVNVPSESIPTIISIDSNTLNSRAAATEPTVSIAYSCLFIPLVVAFWWYWTKRKARKLVKKLITNTEQCNVVVVDTGLGPPGTAIGDDEDDFHSWQEVMQNESGDSSVKFVRWIKNTKHKGREKVKRNSKQTLHRGRTMNVNREPMLQESFDSASVFDDDISEVLECSGWQYIQHISGNVEICKTQHCSSRAAA